jgi:serine/threonine protein kinase
MNGEKDEVMMKTEIYMLRTVVHKNIVQYICSFMEAANNLWVIMEYMDMVCRFFTGCVLILRAV